MTPVSSSRETSVIAPTHLTPHQNRRHCGLCSCICNFLGHPEHLHRYRENTTLVEQSVLDRIVYIIRNSLQTDRKQDSSSDVIGLGQKPSEISNTKPEQIRDENYSLFLLGLALVKYNKGFDEILSDFHEKTINYYRQDHDPDPKINRSIQVRNYKEALDSLVRMLQNSPFVKECKDLAFDKIHGQTSTPFTSLTHLPEVIRLFENLESLDLSNNLLSNLPHCLERLPLSKLSLHNNRFELMPEVIFRMPKLKTLDLSKNPLKSFSSRLSSLESLELLYMDDTQSLLDSIPPSMPKLSKVFISGPNSQHLDFSLFQQKYPFFSIIYHKKNIVELSGRIQSKL